MKLTERLSDKVRALLIKRPETRDSDMELLAWIWFMEGGDGDKFKFLRRLADNKLPNPETVRRTRQLLQQENPDLRGAKYKKRQNHAKAFKKDVKKIKKYAGPQMEMI